MVCGSLVLSYRKEKSMSDKKTQGKTPLFKRVVALAGVILLLGVYVVFFFQAVLGKTGPESAFLTCAAATVAIPIVIWMILWVYTVLTGNRTVASADSNGLYDVNKLDNEDGKE